MTILYGGYEISLNERLLDKQNVWGNLHEIIKIRIEIKALLTEEEHTLVNGGLTKVLADKFLHKLNELDYKLQELWGFERDGSRLTYWLELKGCCCGKLDNYDLIGTGRRIVNSECVYHWR